MHTRTVKKCDFDFLTEWFYLVFRKTILTGSDQSICRSVNMSTHIDQWTGEPVNTPY